jgi:hypothetical protein
MADLKFKGIVPFFNFQRGQIAEKNVTKTFSLLVQTKQFEN